MYPSEDQKLTKKERRALRREGRRTEEEHAGRSRRTRSILWVSVAIGVVGAAVIMARLASRGSGNTAAPAAAIAAISNSDWIWGNPSAAVTLVEYGDFQCPACGAYYPLVHQIQNEFKNNIRFVYRHFPLPQHEHAKPAAYAAEAAGRQGKFWEMYDLLYSHQNDWAESKEAAGIFLGYAESLSLDMTKFKEDLASAETASRVADDTNDGIAAGVNATPTFFLDGKKITNPANYDEFRSLIAGDIAAHQ